MFVSTGVREQIDDLQRAGLSEPEIARQLGLARPTVAYHLARIRDGSTVRYHSAPGDPGESPGVNGGPAAPSAPIAPTTRAAVAALLAAGLTRAQAARTLGLSKGTVTYHARRLDQPVDDRCARRYDWEAIQRFYDEGHSVRECMAVFGFSSASWFEAVKRGAVEARPAEMPIDDLLRAGTYRGRYHLKARLIREGLKTERCECCGLVDWQGEPITLALHHVNGIRDDNRLANLQLLCPNCHSQTDTFAGRNPRRAGR